MRYDGLFSSIEISDPPQWTSSEPRLRCSTCGFPSDYRQIMDQHEKGHQPKEPSLADISKKLDRIIDLLEKR